MVNKRIQDIIDRQTEPWGIKVGSVEVRDVILPETMKRAMARKAESERDRRANVIAALREDEAAERPVPAGQMIASTPTGHQRRFLQTMSEVSEENSTFTFLPIPLDFIDAFRPQMKNSSGDKATG